MQLVGDGSAQLIPSHLRSCCYPQVGCALRNPPTLKPLHCFDNSHNQNQHIAEQTLQACQNPPLDSISSQTPAIRAVPNAPVKNLYFKQQTATSVCQHKPKCIGETSRIPQSVPLLPPERSQSKSATQSVHCWPLEYFIAPVQSRKLWDVACLHTLQHQTAPHSPSLLSTIGVQPSLSLCLVPKRN